MQLTLKNIIDFYNEELIELKNEKKKITKKEFLECLQYTVIVEQVIDQILYLRKN